jgi:Cof subfamily protein (haloacid dehalogenase superfamily)
MSAPFQYVITDMDGTLLAPDHFMTDYTRETLKKLVHEHGVTLVMATGRNSADVKIVSSNLRKYIWGANLEVVKAVAAGGQSNAPAMYLLTSNGAVAHNTVTDELVFQSCVDPVIAEKLYRLLPESEEVVNTNIYQQDDWICRVDWPEMMSAHKESGIRFIHVPSAPPRSAEPVPSTDPCGLNRGVAVGNYDNISKVFFITDDVARLPGLTEEVEKVVASCGGKQVSLTFSASDCMDIMAEGVSKGQAIRKLFETLLSPRDGHDVVAEALQASIAFGDGLNDAEMLTEVGKGCVMGNASPKLKAQHPELEVVLPNSEDGVARKLRSVFGIPL